ncbi:hypothetical protein F503_07281 [Ophiostoma piceae UAMH 11346]|uniref:Uncharacterized protein n=1 Tax=Ophiostoma piceae (strain UAMH 11346) TaxID=1262450 RepID=S3D7U9_OPHP1|nr:hypothetical protein F503_07281 [Ophiostoma piceae UAMH 11346]
MAFAGANQDVILQAMTYDGPSVFLQGEDNLSMKAEGIVISPSRLEQASVDVQVIATFTNYHSRTEAEMNCRFESSIMTLVEHDENSGEYVYHFKSDHLSNFNTMYSGEVELSANVTVCNQIRFTSFYLADVTVISHEDQSDNRARQIAFDRDFLTGDQGPGLYSGRAEDSSFYRDPVVPIPEMGDQGYGEYIGPGDETNWQYRTPSPAASYISTEANTEVRLSLLGDDSEYGMMDARLDVRDARSGGGDRTVYSDDFASDTFDDAPRDFSEGPNNFFN